MAAYKSLQMTEPRYPVSGPGFGGRSVHVARGTFDLTAALAENDTIDLFYLHKGFRVTGGYVKTSDLDTDGTPTITLDVGDADDVDRYFDGSTVAQAGGVDRTMAAAGVGYLTTKKTLVQAKVSAAVATGAATGTVEVVLEGIIEEPA